MAHNRWGAQELNVKPMAPGRAQTIVLIQISQYLTVVVLPYTSDVPFCTIGRVRVCWKCLSSYKIQSIS